MAMAGGSRLFNRLCGNRARSGDRHLAVRLRSARRGLPVDSSRNTAARKVAGGPPGDEPVLPIARQPKARALAMLIAATARLELGFATRGASPTWWRACHPSCADADAGSGASVRFAETGDPPLLRLLLRGGERTVNLDDL